MFVMHMSIQLDKKQEDADIYSTCFSLCPPSCVETNHLTIPTAIEHVGLIRPHKLLL